MATIVRRTGKNGHTSYLVRVRRKGAPPQTATFQKLSDAKKWAQITEGTVLEGRHFKTTEAKRHTVSDLFTHYRNDILPQKRPSTIYNQVYHLRWWESQLGHFLLSDISSPLLVECRNKLAKTRGPATVRRYLAVLSHAFSYAITDLGWMEDNPMRKVRKPKAPHGRVRFLSDDERRRLLEACRQSRNKHLYVVVVLALSTGARRGELLNLRWPDVDLKRGTLTFHQTKNGETRCVPLARYALNVLQQHANVRRLGTLLVFPDPIGRKPLSIRDAFGNAVKRAGVSNFVFHDLRHCCGSYLAMSGASLLDISTILGHKSLQMTKRYAHLSEAHTRSVVARMNKAIFG